MKESKEKENRRSSWYLNLIITRTRTVSIERREMKSGPVAVSVSGSSMKNIVSGAIALNHTSLARGPL